MVYRRKGFRRGTRRARSTSRRRGSYGAPSFMKRAKTRAYANLRTGGLLAIERKFSDFGYAQANLGSGSPGGGVATGVASDFAPAILGPRIYRSAVGIITSPTGVVSALNVLGPGDTGSDRDGRQVINDSIHLRGWCEYKDSFNPGAFNGHTVVNLVLVLDTQCNGAAPTGGQVFVSPGDFTANGDQSGSNCFVNLSNSKRFRILKHIKRSISPQCVTLAADGAAQGGFLWSMDVPLKGMKTNYVADTAVTTATVASIGDNAIFLFGWASVGSWVAVTYNSRLRFRG